MKIEQISFLLKKKYQLNKSQKNKLLKFIFLLMKWNKKFNIISMKKPNDIITKHILDSLNLAYFLKNGNILDIGSGGGLPSIPIAIIKTNLNFYLLEPKIKKICFIRYIISTLKIKNIYIYHMRIENFICNKKFNFIISRAFMDLKKFVCLFEKSSLKEYTIINMYSYLSMDILKKIFIDQNYKVEIVNLTKTKSIVGHRNLVFIKIKKFN